MKKHLNLSTILVIIFVMFGKVFASVTLPDKFITNMTTTVTTLGDTIETLTYNITYSDDSRVRLVRRLTNYPSIEYYTNSFEAEGINEAEDKILVIGGGLAWDDDVKIFNKKIFSPESEGGRLKFYPVSAYLIDRWMSTYDEAVQSKPDFLRSVDIKGRLPIEFSTFENFFEVIISEYLPFDILRDRTALDNIGFLLKEGGTFIVNNRMKFIESSRALDSISGATPVREVGGKSYVVKATRLAGFEVFYERGREFDPMEKLEIFNDIASTIIQPALRSFFERVEIRSIEREHWFSAACSEGYCVAYKPRED